MYCAPALCGTGLLTVSRVTQNSLLTNKVELSGLASRIALMPCLFNSSLTWDGWPGLKRLFPGWQLPGVEWFRLGWEIHIGSLPKELYLTCLWEPLETHGDSLIYEGSFMRHHKYSFCFCLSALKEKQNEHFRNCTFTMPDCKQHELCFIVCCCGVNGTVHSRSGAPSSGFPCGGSVTGPLL